MSTSVPLNGNRRVCRALCLLPFAFLLLPLRFSAADISRDFNTGVYLYKKGDYELAAKTFEMILTKFPGDARTDEVMYWYGESNYHLGRHADALGIYKKLAAEHPKSKFTPKAIFSAGYAALKLGLYKDAVAFLTDVAEDPGTEKETVIECRIVIADCMLKMGDDKQAEKALRDLLAIPKLPSEKKQEVEFELGRLLIRLGRAKEGRAAFERAAEKAGPHQGEALMALGDAAYAESRYRESLDWYERIFRKVRGVTGEFRARAIYNGAWSYLGLGDLDKARALFIETYESKEAAAPIRGDAALRVAHLYRERRNPTAAEEMAAAADKIAVEQNLPRLKDDVAFFRAESAFLVRKYDEALAFLARVTDKGFRVQKLTGQIFFETNRPLDAATYFERAATAAPGRDDLNLCLFYMGQSFFTAGNYDTAVTVILRIKDPGAALNFRLKPFLAGAFRAAGRYREAAKQFDLLASEAEDTRDAQEYRYYSALASFEGKHYSQAGKTMEVFLDVMGPGGDRPRTGVAGDSIAAAALILHADILSALRKFDDAEVAYLRAIPAVETVGPEHVFIAYTHLVDFSIEHAKDRLVEHIDAFVASMNDTRTYAFIIDRLYEAELYKNLLRYTDEILQKYPSHSQVYGNAAYYQMMAYYKRNDLAAAIKSHESLAKWVQANPSAEIAEEANFWRARFAQGRGDRSLAKSAYYSYLDFHPTGKYVREVTLYLGVMAVEDGQAEEAERHLAKLLAGKGDDDFRRDRILSEAQYNLASARILQNRYEEALAILEPLGDLPIFKTDPAYAYKIGYIYVRLSRLIDAEMRFRSVIQKSNVPVATMDNTIYALLHLLYKSERYADLETDFKRHADRIKDRGILGQAKYLMGMTIFDADRFSEAIPYFKGVKAPADTELVIEASIRLADCEYNLKRYKAALERYTKIADEHGTTHWGREALYSAGLCKIKLGFSESALTGFERFLQQNPEDPLSKDVAREAAKLYLTAGDVDQAEQKLDFLDRHGADGSLLEESMRMRIKIWQKRGDSDKVLTLAKSHRGAYGLSTEVAVAGAEAALKLGRAQDAIEFLDGFTEGSVDTSVRDFMDFYRAEAMQKLGREGAIELYKKLADVSDSDVRLSSRYRYGAYLLEKKEHAKAREMMSSILADPAGKLMPFYLDVIQSAFQAAKEAGESGEVIRMYAKYKTSVTDEKNKILLAEYHFWAQLQTKDHAKALAAAEEMLSLNLDPRRRTEVLLISAQLQEQLKNPDKADAIYSGILSNPAAEADLRSQAESRKITLAISRKEAGRQILEEYLKQGGQTEWTSKASEALLKDAVAEQRHADIIRTVDLIQAKYTDVTPAARYAAAKARLALSDTTGALADFRKVADQPGADTYHAAWSAFLVAQDELGQKNLGNAKKYLAQAWQNRANLDSPAALNTYRQLAEILFEVSDYDGMQTLAADPTPEGLPSEPHLLKGLGAWRAKDYATAARHLKEVVQTSVQLRSLYAESLHRSGDTPAAIAEYERIAEGHGEAAGRAQLSVGELYDIEGKTSESLIGYYKVLAVYESDTQTDLAAEALIRIARVYQKTGEIEKSKNAAKDVINKYPNSMQAKEAAYLAGQ